MVRKNGPKALPTDAVVVLGLAQRASRYGKEYQFSDQKEATRGIVPPELLEGLEPQSVD